jgi:hypothetical protein
MAVVRPWAPNSAIFRPAWIAPLRRLVVRACRVTSLKQTCSSFPAMSASDPKRTSPECLTSRAARSSIQPWGLRSPHEAQAEASRSAP